jgi:3',5'-cyclic AMP phosphodiesterase CpdA
MRRVTVAILTIIGFLTTCIRASVAEEPIAVISNPYVTTLPANQIKDENGRLRDFLAQTAPPSMEKTVELVNRVQPDALVVLGSLTWSGSAGDMAAFAKYLDRIKVTTFTLPGHRDLLAAGLAPYQQHFGKVDASRSIKTIKGVTLAFADDLHADPDAATKRLVGQLNDTKSSQAVLLFGGKESEFARSKLTPGHKTFYNLVEQKRVAVRFDPVRYSHQVAYENTLPVWTVGSTAWSTRGAITLVRVYADRVEMSQIADLTQPAFSMTVPNPVTAPRLKPVANDPYGSPSMVFIAGDLVNNNLPEEWLIFNKVFSKLKPPQHSAPGNHDVLFNYDFVEQSYSSAPQKKPEYAAIVKQALADAAKDGFKGPTALYEKHTGSKPQHVIEYKSAAFIIVSFLTMRADAVQIEFLRKQLERTKDKRHVFVVAHYPSLPAFGNNVQPKLGGDEVLALLRQYKVTGYLFGHRHRNGFRIHDGTAHILTDNMGSIHLFHVFSDQIVIGRRRVGVALYETLAIPATRR